LDNFMVNTRKGDPRKDLLQTLFHHRWGPPILVELHRTAGSKFITLVQRLGAPKDSVQRTLGALIDAKWVERNPGHGHPLRPEYLLTREGDRIARICSPLLRELREGSLEEVGLKKWSMPVVFALRQGPQRFSELKAELTGVSSRALTIALKDLVERRVVERTVSDGYPPAVVYRLEEHARSLQRCLADLT
jgi:DNA-binding HxlR family transcriptional regulator